MIIMKKTILKQLSEASVAHGIISRDSLHPRYNLSDDVIITHLHRHCLIHLISLALLNNNETQEINLRTAKQNYVSLRNIQLHNIKHHEPSANIANSIRLNRDDTLTVETQSDDIRQQEQILFTTFHNLLDITNNNQDKLNELRQSLLDTQTSNAGQAFLNNYLSSESAFINETSDNIGIIEIPASNKHTSSYRHGIELAHQHNGAIDDDQSFQISSNPKNFLATMKGIADYHLVTHKSEPIFMTPYQGHYPIKNALPIYATLFAFINKAKHSISSFDPHISEFNCHEKQLLDFAKAFQLIEDRQHAFTFITQWLGLSDKHPDNTKVQHKLLDIISLNPRLHALLNEQSRSALNRITDPNSVAQLTALRTAYHAHMNQVSQRKHEHQSFSSRLRLALFPVKSFFYSAQRLLKGYLTLRPVYLIIALYLLGFVALTVPGIIAAIPVIGALTHLGFWSLMTFTYSQLGLLMILNVGKSRSDLLHEGLLTEGLITLRQSHMMTSNPSCHTARSSEDLLPSSSHCDASTAPTVSACAEGITPQTTPTENTEAQQPRPSCCSRLMSYWY